MNSECSDNKCFTITNNSKQIVPSYTYYLILKLSITASLCGSRVYIGMYIHDCMNSECSDNKCFTITNNLKQIVPSYTYYLILKLSITASLYCSRVYFAIGICIYDCSHNIPFYHIAIL